MAVNENLSPSRIYKTLNAMKAERTIKRITFDPSVANPQETLYVTLPRLGENEVIVPGSLALRFNIDLSGGHPNNFLVQNVTRALIDRLTVKFSNEVLQDTNGFDIYKIYEDLFMSQEERDNRVQEGIQTEDQNKIRCGGGDKPTSGVDAENELEKIYKNKYRLRLDHQILTDHRVFYPKALPHNLTFDQKLAPASQVVRGSDKDKLEYKLTNIQLEYEAIRSVTLADSVLSEYTNGKQFPYDHVQYIKTVKLRKDTDSQFTITMNPQRRSLKAILLLFLDPYTAGATDSEKYINPDLKKVNVTIKGTPNKFSAMASNLRTSGKKQGGTSNSELVQTTILVRPI